MQGKIKLNLQGKKIARNGNCKEWNLQGKENGREMVDLAMCGICKERKMPGKIKLNLQGKEIARNGICKKTVLQVEVTFFITRLM